MYVVYCNNKDLLEDMSCDGEGGCTIIVDEQKHIMTHKNVLDIVHSYSWNLR